MRRRLQALSIAALGRHPDKRPSGRYSALTEPPAGQFNPPRRST